MFLLYVVLLVVVGHVNSALARPPYKHKPCPPFLCMQLDSLWDTHPDKGDQCYFIKPCMRSGDDSGGVGCWCSSVSLVWKWEAVRFSREKKEGLFFRFGWGYNRRLLGLLMGCCSTMDEGNQEEAAGLLSMNSCYVHNS